jgi:DUF971 family protein
MTVQPTGLRLDENNRLLIDWSDGQQRRYGVRMLRDACPCASCREKKSQPVDPMQLPTLTMAQAQPMRILGMKPVGNYAYAVSFSDGHDTGIFTFELLRELGEVV